MRGFVPRLGPVVLFLIGLGFDLSPYQNETISYVLWGIAALWGLYVAWPWIKRWRPFTLAPANGNSTSQVFTPTIEQLSPETSRELAQLRKRVEQLTAERDALKEEKRQELQKRRQERIEEWRSVIRNLDSGAVGFADTDTYSQMKPYLRPEVIKMLEAPRTMTVGIESRGNFANRHTLLDEVTRIEREWDLI